MRANYYSGGMLSVVLEHTACFIVVGFCVSREAGLLSFGFVKMAVGGGGYTISERRVEFCEYWCPKGIGFG